MQKHFAGCIKIQLREKRGTARLKAAEENTQSITDVSPIEQPVAGGLKWAFIGFHWTNLIYSLAKEVSLNSVAACAFGRAVQL